LRSRSAPEALEAPAYLWAWQKVTSLATLAHGAPIEEVQVGIRSAGTDFNIVSPETSMMIPGVALLSAPMLGVEQGSRPTAIHDQIQDGQTLSVPTTAELVQNYPNPFNPNTTIQFSAEGSEHVRLAIYNVSGQLVRTTTLGPAADGRWTWDGRDDQGRDVASGIYIYRLETAWQMIARRMLLLR
jgi:hypothetical protein